MPVEVALPFVMLTIAGLLAFWRGGPPERAAAIIIAALIVTDVSYHLRFGPSGFVDVDPVHLLLDGSELVAITVLAMRANRVWPLWAAAAQLICFSGHIAALIEPGGMSLAYWAMTQIPLLIQLIALGFGVVAHARRERRIGPYRSWRSREARA